MAVAASAYEKTKPNGAYIILHAVWLLQPVGESEYETTIPCKCVTQKLAHLMYLVLLNQQRWPLLQSLMYGKHRKMVLPEHTVFSQTVVAGLLWMRSCSYE